MIILVTSDGGAVAVSLDHDRNRGVVFKMIVRFTWPLYLGSFMFFVACLTHSFVRGDNSTSFSPPKYEKGLIMTPVLELMVKTVRGPGLCPQNLGSFITAGSVDVEVKA